MKFRLLFVIIILAFVTTTACGFSINLGNERIRGSGNVVTETREVSGFNKVLLSGTGELIVTQGDKEALSVETDDNLLPYIITEVNNGQLELKLKPRLSLLFNTRLIYHLTVKDLNEIQIAGSGKVTIDRLNTSRLDLNTSGSGKFEIDDLQADSLSATTSGSGQFVISGKADNVSVEINGSGKFACPDLESRNVTVRINGSGEVTVWAKDTLDVRISGSGAVRYYGNPQIDQSISGSGNVRRLGDK
ncbi:MAG TPA: DUF2807 domain-containing protein [Anaerolinea thermolimosa]|uniref:DUF2807 domain-containing protein n=1 Tax=Anaerolinea thermolimosa TaxID=229919 RepID=A0A3D1JHQ7_9CHLR|nr:head GIN domain-containing protein [Anaerolinea thermolimosa]GAP07042.1 hypothetical protein ATHL_01908 [Anaerolinea thermolimosa]HCE18110.1 DUF2807 domain-containing protein [Anaerolinea thermolimosa]